MKIPQSVALISNKIGTYIYTYTHAFIWNSIGTTLYRLFRKTATPDGQYGRLAATVLE